MNHRSVLLFGNTCTGKSELARRFGEAYGWRYLSFGELRRREIRNITHLGSELAAYDPYGSEMSPELGMRLIVPEMKEENLVSGYPITNRELELFLTVSDVAGFVLLTASRDTIVRRTFSRKACRRCGYVTQSESVCPVDGETLVPRPGRSAEELEKRFQLYERQIDPFVTNALEPRFPGLRVETNSIDAWAVFEQVRGWWRGVDEVARGR